ncbi:restriction endonuclease subunit S [Candidatus Bathyarchaeota archaeon]|nr:restriction endonuclease subunit S [Candidatus Bathyarchaeota archaeon]
MKINKLNLKWESMPFPTLLNKKKFYVGKIKRNEYLDQGKYPIVDQGQGFIAGYSNDASLVYNGDLPIIVFGDHTRIFKYIDFPFIAGADGTQIIVPKKDIINPNYFYYTLLNTPIFNRGYNRHYSLLKEKKIPVPPFVEQRGIVEILGTVDECIRLTDAVIDGAEELKRGLMQQLLTRGIGHTEYKETPLGKIPKTWKLSTFGKECYIGTGGTPRRNQSDYYNGNIPWVKSTELNYGIISDTEEHISKRALEESNAKIYPTGTLLIAMYGLEAVGTRGRCAILGVNAATNQAIAAIQPKKQILPRFLYYFYQQMGNLIMKYAEGTKRKNLSLSIMKKIPIIVPPIKEQEKIVKIVENQDDRIKIENHKMNQLNILKQGLMQSLLSGKIRVELKGDGLHRIGYGRKANN